jgi:hypothetical protein
MCRRHEGRGEQLRGVGALGIIGLLGRPRSHMKRRIAANRLTRWIAGGVVSLLSL